MAVKPIDIHIHPFTEEAVLGHGPSYTEAHYNFFGRSPEAPHHGKKHIDIDATYRTFKEAGIDKAVIVNMVSYNQWGRAMPNDYLAIYAQKYPDLFIPFAGVDPHMGSPALREIDRAVKELGCRGLKFHPAYQAFHPDDRELMWPIYARCVELDIAILVHTGTTRMTRCDITGCRPLALDVVATEFPDLRIIMTHFGWPWTEEALAVCWRNENVYMDLSGWLPRYVYATQPIVFQYMNTVLQDKMVFGSDYPAISPKVWLEDFNAIVKKGYDWGGEHHEMKPQVVEKFLRGNGLKALKLPGP
ncbi:MAG: amidohydrolase [Chloroflexi bacterium]|nr:amidohydrolase [Chloroflexota bacterium]